MQELPALGISKLRLSVIIPTYRRYIPLIGTLENILAQRDVDFEVIVVDQNPAWPHDLALRVNQLAAHGKVKWLIREQPAVVSARHDAIEASTGDVFVFVDDDVVIPDPFFLARHAANYAAVPELDVVVGREIYQGQPLPHIAPFPPQREELTRGQRWTGTPRDQALGFDRTGAVRHDVVAFCTCNSSVTREAFFRVAGFDESFRGNAYGDDYDFAIRLGECGGQFVYDPTAWLIHLQAPAGGLRMSDPHSPVAERDKIYPSVLFLLKNWEPPWRWYLLWRVLRRSVFLKVNIKSPWRLPAVCLGLWRAWRDARVDVRAGPYSRFHDERPSSLSP